MNHKLKLFLDVAPLAVFFIAYRFFGVFAATGAIIASTMISLAITYAYEKKISPMPLVSGVIIAVFGAMTLYLHDETFIKMKPTMVNMVFAGILLGGALCKQSLIKLVMESAIALDDAGWRKLSIRWGFFFLFLAGLNEFIWRNFSTDFWVNFKVFGMLTLTILFTLAQMPLIKKHMKDGGAEG